MIRSWSRLLCSKRPGHRSTGHDREAAELVAGLLRARLDDAG